MSNNNVNTCHILLQTLSINTCHTTFHTLAAVVVEFDPTTYTVAESEGVVMFRVVKRTMTTQPVSVFFSTSPDTATGRASCC